MATQSDVPRGGMMTPRIQPKEITGLYGAVVKTFSAKMFGQVPESLGVMWHHVPVLKASMRYGQKLQQWDECDDGLKSFAHMAVASLVGCSWCLDFNYFMADNRGLDVERARHPAVACVRSVHAARAAGAGVCR